MRDAIKTEFIQFLRDSLSHDGVQDVYYGLRYWQNTKDYLFHAVNNPQLMSDLQDYFERYHERVFCYELYYQLRKRIEASELDYSGIYLQSEVRKEKLSPQVLAHFEIAMNLNRNYMPDFLLHTPGDFSNQLLVMEVKTNPNILLQHIEYDVQKLAEFMDQSTYRYEKGIFLCVNVQPEIVFKMISDYSDRFEGISEAVKSELLIVGASIQPSRTLVMRTLLELVG